MQIGYAVYAHKRNYHYGEIYPLLKKTKNTDGQPLVGHFVLACASGRALDAETAAGKDKFARSLLTSGFSQKKKRRHNWKRKFR